MINLFLVDDHSSLLDCLSVVLNNEDDLNVLGCATEGKTAVLEIRKLKPDIVILDIELGKTLGITLAEEIIEKYKSKVIAFTAHDNIKYIQQIMLTGASGYVLKTSKVEELIDAIRKVDQGGEYISESLTNALVRDYKGQLKKSHPLLTPREREISELISKGMSRQDIADYFSVDKNTISTHRSNIMKKLGIKSNAELARYTMTEEF